MPLKLAETVSQLWPALQELARCGNLSCLSDLQVRWCQGVTETLGGVHSLVQYPIIDRTPYSYILRNIPGSLRKQASLNCVQCRGWDKTEPYTMTPVANPETLQYTGYFSI